MILQEKCVIPSNVYFVAKKIAEIKNISIDEFVEGCMKLYNFISLSDKAKELQRYKDILEVTGGRLVPEWLDSDLELTALKATIKSLPTREQIDVPVNEMLIVELYSK